METECIHKSLFTEAHNLFRELRWCLFEFSFMAFYFKYETALKSYLAKIEYVWQSIPS